MHVSARYESTTKLNLHLDSNRPRENSNKKFQRLAKQRGTPVVYTARFVPAKSFDRIGIKLCLLHVDELTHR